MTDDGIRQTIIGFGGPIGSGKNTAADMAEACIDTAWKANKPHPNAVQPLTIQLGFADEVKKVAGDYFHWDGIKDERGRRLLQVLGTEAGRAYNPDIWVEKVMSRLYHCDNNASVLITDCRFPNEVDFCNRHGYTILMSNRGLPNVGIDGHASETSLA